MTTLTLSGAVRTIPLKQKRINYRKMVVMGFYEDEKPQYVQGYNNHELLSVVTADECNRMIEEINRLRLLCANNGIETTKPVESWVAQNSAWIDSTIDENESCFSAGISCPSWGHVIQAHAPSSDQALAIFTEVFYNCRSWKKPSYSITVSW